MSLDQKAMSTILSMQQNERNECEVYRAIAARTKNEENKKILLCLADEEYKHYEIWRKYTNRDLKVQRIKVTFRKLAVALLGFTFVIKLMEKGEQSAQRIYSVLSEEIPESAKIQADEVQHEQALMDMLDEERLRYVGSMVLGLNDALVELTGTLAGLTLALQNTKIIALSGLITGISATLSMASSEYLSAKSEGRSDAFKSCVYTGIAYVITVTLLILPYLLFPAQKYMFALFTMLAVVVLIIFVFNYYISVAKELPFKKRFLEMALISLSVAALSFVIGLLVKKILGIDL